MGTELTSFDPMPRTVIARFYGVELVILPDRNGTDWISQLSIFEAMAFASRTYWGEQIRQLEAINIAVLHHGEIRTLRFVDRRAFFNLALNHETFQEFRQAVLDLVEAQHEHRTLTIDPEDAKDPLIRHQMETLLLTRQLRRAERRLSRVEETSVRADSNATKAVSAVANLSGRVDSLGRRMDETEVRIVDARQRLWAGPPPGLTLRAKVRFVVENFGALSHPPSDRDAYQDLYMRAYRELNLLKGINISALAHNRGISRIEYAERAGLLPDLYAIVERLYRLPYLPPTTTAPRPRSRPDGSAFQVVASGGLSSR